MIFSITNNRNKPSGGSRNIKTKSNNYQDTSIQKITSMDPNLNPADFKSQAFNIYKEIQTAWMNFDTDTIRKLTTDEFIRRAKEIHNDKYDYSKVNYKGYDIKVCIICPKHGEF